MMSSTALTGKNNLGDNPPYILAITSHKGGTGRTTLAAGIAWLWGQRGLKVALVDADPVRAAALLVANAEGVCSWTNVSLVVAQQGLAKIPPGMDAVIIDSPPATEPLAQRVFAKADGVVICSLADSLALNTLPAATRAVRDAREVNPELDLLGIAVNIFNSSDVAQTRCLSALRGARGGLFVEPPIPARPELRDWPLHPGTELPDGPGRVALRALADIFRDQIVESGWEQFANRRGASHAYAASR